MKYLNYIISGVLILIVIGSNIRIPKSKKMVLNSNYLITYLKENNLLDKVNYVCNNHYCSDRFEGDRETEIKQFIENYLAKVRQESPEEAINLEYKGFAITKIGY